ncbi:hypothetical protein PRO82_001055 [Candidatus Protochlamydia amoebophila]|uniref:hypothetical protein n=1 Tax=Candidatus Protochlamydia amoebophila TaxID=362787 RepID=UPI001BD8DA5B|nr:hypothetical protein [Candidatus Protochlamydia amoebophila]MBS4163749.1 hypothetical protein [Candidatus Protochlamydia amoebophila]
MKKAIVFTDSQRIQAYLFSLLEQSGYKGQVAILNGTNTDKRSKDIYKNWIERHEGQEIINEILSVDIKAAIVEEFRGRSIMTLVVLLKQPLKSLIFNFVSLWLIMIYPGIHSVLSKGSVAALLFSYLVDRSHITFKIKYNILAQMAQNQTTRQNIKQIISL